MLDNVIKRADLLALSRRMKQSHIYKSVKHATLDEYLESGWSVVRENKNSTRIGREKKKSVLLEHRVWSLLYKMNFPFLSGEGGAKLITDQLNPKSPKTQIDVVGISQEVALAIECKSSVALSKKRNFKDYIASLALVRKQFADAIKSQFKSKAKRTIILIMFTWDILLNEQNIERAKRENIILLDQNHLDYYERLVAHLGEAAKYLFLAELMPNRTIKSLEIKIPALKASMGKYTCYTFSIKPSYLLKVASVLHRARSKAIDVQTYQRMIKKSRLKQIRRFISNKGVFPTNIVVNMDKKHVQFDLRAQEGGPEGTKFGTLHLRPSYGSVRIIDGQHRLFAYSGHPMADSDYLHVLAFEGLPENLQAKMFVDINHEQKSVKRSLLYELAGELKKDAKGEKQLVEAIVSTAVQGLNEIMESPFDDRLLLTDADRTDTRCIPLTGFVNALKQPGMFIVKEGISYGTLWAGDFESTVERAMKIVNTWFELIRSGAKEWWELGAAEGGGLAMSDGVTISIGVLRSVFNHLNKEGYNLVELSNRELCDLIQPFGAILGEYLGSLTADGRHQFRLGSRGVQGQTARRRECEKAIHDKYPAFNPPGLREELALQAAKTNEKAFSIIQRIEPMLKTIIMNILKEEYGRDKSWLYKGIPKKIREKILLRQDEDEGKYELEDYFDLIDFRTIIVYKTNWSMFKENLAIGRKGNKEKKTEWMVKLNDMRKVVMHPVRSRNIDWEELENLKDYEEHLKNIINDSSS